MLSRPPRDRAHPRACGENDFYLMPGHCGPGSSPRMRGKPGRNRWRRSRHGLIPAHAGKTAGVLTRSASERAHPRACGENRANDGGAAFRAGSSPRMRGKRRRPALPVTSERLIPAHAGKTLSQGFCLARMPAHPRACGENSIPIECRFTVQGSSPRMRGKLMGRHCQLPRPRLIPAHAGKTNDVIKLFIILEAHPRACGENLKAVPALWGCMGSSPRMRGKRLFQVAGHLDGRLIPAHAGKTDQSPVNRPARTAHPRACGENAEGNLALAQKEGSSPRMRGKPRRPAGRRRPRGLIPAHAGKTCSTAWPCRRPWAHPRACGENRTAWPRTVRSLGSSPRMRGKL